MNLDSHKKERIVTPVTLGIDLKITEDNRVGIVEINGENSGISGLSTLLNEYNNNLGLAFKLKRNYLYWYKASVLQYQLEDQEETDGYFDVMKNSDSLQSRQVIFANNELEGFLSLSEILENSDDKNFPYNKINLKIKLYFSLVIHLNLKFEIIDLDGIDKFLLSHGILNCGWDDELGLLVQYNADLDSEDKVIEAIMHTYNLFPKTKPCIVVVSEKPEEHSIFIDPKHIVLKYPATESEIKKHDTAKVSGEIESKIRQKKFIPKENRAPSKVWNQNREELINFLDSLKRDKSGIIDIEKFPYIVIKPINSAHGNGIDVLHIDDIEGIFGKLESNSNITWLIEGFIPSKPIHNHDGCMRYLVDFQVIVEDGRMSISRTLETAYWRLSPSELDSNSRLNEKYKANLTGKTRALPARAEIADIELVKPLVDVIVRQIAIEVQRSSIVQSENHGRNTRVENPTVVVRYGKNGSVIFNNLHRYSNLNFDSKTYFRDFPEIRFKK